MRWLHRLSFSILAFSIAVLLLGCAATETPRVNRAGITPPYLAADLTRIAASATPTLSSPLTGQAPDPRDTLVPTTVLPYLSATESAPQVATRAAGTAPTPQVLPATLSGFQPPDLQELQQLMLELINRDRATAGLAPVQLDSLSTQVGQAHAEEMAAHGYMSHWNLKGLGPDLRYSLAGGRDAVMENVHMSWHRYSNGTPVPVSDWKQVVRDAEAGWVSSPGHRANILAPEHTHVGIGIAYNPATGDIRMTQEFVNHYVELDPLPQTLAPGDTLAVSGRLLPGVSAPLVNLAYEPAPRAMTITELNTTRTYSSPAQFVAAITPQADVHGRFKVSVPLDRGGPPGVYHARMWVTRQGAQVLAADAVVLVGGG